MQSNGRIFVSGRSVPHCSSNSRDPSPRGQGGPSVPGQPPHAGGGTGGQQRRQPGGGVACPGRKGPARAPGKGPSPAPLRAAAVAFRGGERIPGKATSVRPAKALSTHAAAARTPPASAWHFQHKLVASKHAGKPTRCPRKPTRQKAALAEIRLLFPHCQVSPSAGKGSEPESHRRRRSRGQGALAGGELASRS